MRKLIYLLFVTGVLSAAQAQQPANRYACIAFYNVENLFDTIDDPETNDNEFLPQSANCWTSARYRKKISDLSGVIAAIGTETTSTPPIIVGLCEIENATVIQDLIGSDCLKEYHYGIVHYPSADSRGMDVGLIYQKSRFTVLYSQSHRLLMPDDPSFRSRESLLVIGALDENDTLCLIVNHFPSRRGGEKASEHKRIAAALLVRTLCDSLLYDNPMAKIIVMGDFNDNPVDKSIVQYLQAKGKPSPNDLRQLFNTSASLYRDGLGSCAYRDQWNLYDQMMVSQGLLRQTPRQKGYYHHKTYVFNDPKLTNKTGNYRQYPFRTYAAGRYQGGYSDHFPTYLILTKPIQ
jgi:predicted extracellular nuclease